MADIRKALEWHPLVAWVGRVNRGMVWVRGRPLHFNDIDGCSDLVGQMKDGRFLGVEVKRPSKRGAATDEQVSFLERVRKFGGVAFVAASVEDVIRELGAA